MNHGLPSDYVRLLEEVFQQAPSFLHVLRGPTFIFEFANDAYYHLVGRRDLIGRPAFDALPEAAAGGYQERILGVMATREPFHGRELTVTLARTPGAPPEERIIDLVYVPLLDADGTCTRVLGHGIDVTDHVHARREVEQLLAESEATNAALADAQGVLQEQQLELELTNQQLQDNAAELEVQTEELSATAESLARANDELLEQDRKLRTFVDAIPTLAWTARADGFIEWYNARWYEFTGTTPAQMEGWGWQSVHDPAVLPDVLERWQASIASGQPFEMTFPLRGTDGTYCQFLTRVVPLTDADGRVVRWFGTNTDVAPERTAREAAETASRRLALQYSVGQVLAAAEGFREAIPDVLRAVAEQLGWPLVCCWCPSGGTDVLRMTATWRAPSDRGLADEAVAAFDAVNREFGFSPGVGLVGGIWQAGTPAWISNLGADANFQRRAAAAAGFSSVFGFPIRGGDEVFGVVELFHPEMREPDPALLQTVSSLGGQLGQFIERKRAERRLRGSETAHRAVLEVSPDAVITMDDSGQVTEFNPAAERIFGYQRAEAVGRALGDLIVPHRLRDAHRRGLERYLATGEARVLGQRVELTGMRADGTEFPVELAITRVPGQPRPMFTGFLRDITDRVRAGEERDRLLHAEREARAEAEEARARAEEANRAKSEFLAVMSHELRTPLNAIGGYAELLEMGLRGTVTPAQVEDLRRIQKSQHHLLGLINGVLNYARVETGTIRYDLTDVPIGGLIVGVELMVAPQLRAKGLVFTTACRPDIAMRADPEKVQQILVNLLSNAVKFTDSGGTVELSCDGASDRVRIRVRDTGVGIPADKLEAIFDPFMQVDQRLTRRHDGVGLGLAISRDLARGMGGDLTAESAPGKGSTFTLTLPAATE
ncbi:MAG TPA: PAS domain S-box protein [Gemmatimonadaceae bacterium]|nr:PAS domain S-box protein [Gemmatimonadaceae bacterium]